MGQQYTGMKQVFLANIHIGYSVNCHRVERMILCPDCGHEEPDGERFCGQCGRCLDDTAGASIEWGLPVSGTEYYYSYEWFGQLHRFKKWNWDLGIALVVMISAIGGLFYLGVGWWVNALIFFSTMSLAAYLLHIIGKRKYGIGALFAVTFLVMLPGCFLATIPWQALHAEYLEEKYAPKFSDTITYTIQREEDGVHIICDGEVINYGRTGSRAIVEFKANGGWPQEGQEFEVFDALVVQKVSTDWIAPDGGSVHVHWECVLSYFNSDGHVYWLIEPYS